MKRINKGFTMVELLITMFIAAILLGFATPSFLDMIERNRVRTTAGDLVEFLRMSRVAAVEQRNIISVCGSSDLGSCDGSWGTSIISIKRGQGDDASDEVLATFNISDKVTITKNNAANPIIDFRVSGWVPWDQTTFFICPTEGKQQNAYRVVVSASGKIKAKSNNDGEISC